MLRGWDIMGGAAKGCTHNLLLAALPLLLLLIGTAYASEAAPVQTAYYINSTTIGGSRGLTLLGNYIYALGYTTNTIAAFDIAGANASAPVQTAYYNNDTSLNDPYAAKASGNYLYIVSYTSKSLTTFDIAGTNASSPKQTAYYTNSTSLNAPRTITISGNYLYVPAVSNKSLTTFSIAGANASAPKQVNNYRNDTSLNASYSIEASGNYLYVASSNGDSLTTFDIAGANASSPKQVNYYTNATSLNGTTTVKAYGNYLYMIAVTPMALTTFSIAGTNASAPVQVNYYTNDTSLNVPYSIAMSGSHLYVSSSTGDSLTTFDIAGTNVSAPVQVNYYTNTTTTNGAYFLAVSGNYLYLVSNTISALTTFDITPPPTPLDCGYLNSANTVYNMTGNVAINGSTCFTVNATNVTLNCGGYSIMGNDTGGETSDTFGISSNQANTTIKNCIISKFATAVYFNGAVAGTVQNTSAYSINYNGGNRGHGIFFNNAVNSSIIDSYANASVYFPIYANIGSGNTIRNTTILGTHPTTGNVALVVDTSPSLTVINSDIRGKSDTRGAFELIASTNTVIANNTINGKTGGLAMWMAKTTTNTTLINNTFLNASTLLIFDPTFGAALGGNTICLNNFSNTGTIPTYYINDQNGSNFYNCTYDSKNQGNIYGNVINGSIAVTGTVNSSIQGLYIGSAGAGFPYSNSTSGGKFSCNFAGCQDNAPLTPTLGITNSCTYSSGNWVINLADKCNFTASQSVGANTITFNGTGYASFYNSSLSPMIFTASRFILTNFMCSASVPCFYFKSAIWFNGTMN